MSRCNVLIRAVAGAGLTAAVFAGPAAADQIARERAAGAAGREMQTSRWVIRVGDHRSTPWAQACPRRATAASASALAMAGIAGTRRPRSQTA
jgi:hypothetical protein